jgi:hypothetical protein
VRRPENGERVLMLAPETENGRTWRVIGIVSQEDGMSDADAEAEIARLKRKHWLLWPKRQIAVVEWQVNEPPAVL